LVRVNWGATVKKGGLSRREASKDSCGTVEILGGGWKGKKGRVEEEFLRYSRLKGRTCQGLSEKDPKKTDTNPERKAVKRLCCRTLTKIEGVQGLHRRRIILRKGE